jgi:uncharacterized membrane protein YqiK
MNHLTTSKIAAYLAIIFIAGGATGAVITLKNARAQETQAPSMEKACNRFQDRLISKLGLTEEQVIKLQPVFEETAQELRFVHSKAVCEADQIIRSAHHKIAKELTPEQKVTLDQFEAERKEWLDRRFKQRDRSKGRNKESNNRPLELRVTSDSPDPHPPSTAHPPEE